MKIRYTEGCVFHDSLTIDGEETINLGEEKLKEILKFLIDKENDIAVLRGLLTSIIEFYRGNTHISNEPCERCGNCVTVHTLEIN